MLITDRIFILRLLFVRRRVEGERRREFCSFLTYEQLLAKHVLYSMLLYSLF
jgi:hypothetical protein